MRCDASSLCCFSHEISSEVHGTNSHVHGSVEYVNICCVAFHVLVDVKGADGTPGRGSWKVGAWCAGPGGALFQEVLLTLKSR